MCIQDRVFPYFFRFTHFFLFKFAVSQTNLYQNSQVRSLILMAGVAYWLATCARNPKVPCFSLAARYVQRGALCSYCLANV